ncbi:MAG: esterase-like activity of phytase family protein [Bacteroidota bacterium]
MADRFRFAPAAVMLAVVTAFAAGARAEAIVVRAKPVLLHSFDPSVMRVGRLEYRGGLQLSSADTRFGGLSGLLVSADGRYLTAISDRGYWFEAGLVYDRSGLLARIDEASVRELRAPNGKSIARRPAGNAEGLAPGAAGKGVVVSFEMQPKLLLYPAGGGPPVRLKSPPGLEQAPRNEGIEALTRLADGRLLALTEGLRARDGMIGWVGGGLRWSTVTWRTGAGFQPTGATTLPDGDVLVLERRILPPGARVRLLKSADIAEGAALDGNEIARFEGALTFDNLEGIDARRNDDGETLVYLVSDDNYSFLQRTLLSMFRLVE